MSIRECDLRVRRCIHRLQTARQRSQPLLGLGPLGSSSMCRSRSLSTPSQPLSTKPSLSSSRPLTRKRYSTLKGRSCSCRSSKSVWSWGGVPGRAVVDEELGVGLNHRADHGVRLPRVVDPDLVADPDVPEPRGRRVRSEGGLVIDRALLHHQHRNGHRMSGG